jgi:hypothetical protein
VAAVKNSFMWGDTMVWFGRSSNEDSVGDVHWLNVNTSGPDRLMCLDTDPYEVLGGDSGGPSTS